MIYTNLYYVLPTIFGIYTELTNERFVFKSVPLPGLVFIDRPPRVTYINPSAPHSGGGNGGKPKPNTLPRE